MYPIILKIGTEKNEMVLLLSAFAAVGLMCLIAAVLSPVTGTAENQDSKCYILCADNRIALNRECQLKFIPLGHLVGVQPAICIRLSGQTWDVLSILWGYEYGLGLSIVSVSLMYPIIDVDGVLHVGGNERAC